MQPESKVDEVKSSKPCFIVRTIEPSKEGKQISREFTAPFKNYEKELNKKKNKKKRHYKEKLRKRKNQLDKVGILPIEESFFSCFDNTYEAVLPLLQNKYSLDDHSTNVDLFLTSKFFTC